MHTQNSNFRIANKEPAQISRKPVVRIFKTIVLYLAALQVAGDHDEVAWEHDTRGGLLKQKKHIEKVYSLEEFRRDILI